PHSQAPVEPRLLFQPRERLDSIAPLVDERRMASAGLVSAARPLDDHRVATLGPEAADDRREQGIGERFGEWYTHQNRWGGRRPERAIDICDERDVVACHDGYAAFDSDGI